MLSDVKVKCIALLARFYTLFRVVASLGHPLVNASVQGVVIPVACFASNSVEYVGTRGCTVGAPVYGPAFLGKAAFTSKVLIVKFNVH